MASRVPSKENARVRALHSLTRANFQNETTNAMLNRKGQTGWILESNGSLQTDRFGLAQAAARWTRGDIGNGNPGSPVSFGSLHPLWNFLSCDRYTIAHDGVYWSCEAQFFGVQGSPVPIYELDYSTSEEPIETHKDFRTALGGKPGSELHGADFDVNGAFNGFTGGPEHPFANDAEEDAWRGVVSYLSPGAVWRKNYTTNVRPTDIGSLGKLDTPEGSPPAVPEGMNWLYVGLTWEQRGLVYQVRKEWRLSGRRGWNATIYS
jgi:hypothetical protein